MTILPSQSSSTLSTKSKHEIYLRDFLTKETYNDSLAIPTFMKHIEPYKKADKTASKRELQYRRQLTKRRLVSQTTGPTAIKNALNSKTMRPITILKRDRTGYHRPEFRASNCSTTMKTPSTAAAPCGEAHELLGEDEHASGSCQMSTPSRHRGPRYDRRR